jgi:hypothetical protein
MEPKVFGYFLYFFELQIIESTLFKFLESPIQEVVEHMHICCSHDKLPILTRHGCPRQTSGSVTVMKEGEAPVEELQGALGPRKT